MDGGLAAADVTAAVTHGGASLGLSVGCRWVLEEKHLSCFFLLLCHLEAQT